MCTDNHQFLYWSRSAATQRSQLCDHGGGGDFHCVKNWEMFVAGLSSFCLSEQLWFPPEHDKFPSKNKKMEGTNGLDPLM